MVFLIAIFLIGGFLTGMIVRRNSKETLKSSVPKIINIGTKYVPNVGSIGSWGWPTESGYTIWS